MDTATESLNVIQLTEGAVQQVKTLLAAEPNSAGKSLRVYVEQGGCSGMKYGLVFDEKHAEDWAADFQGVSVVIDPNSAHYLQGSTVDYVDDLNGSGFKLSNPNARESCGCGKSFTA